MLNLKHINRLTQIPKRLDQGVLAHSKRSLLLRRLSREGHNFASLLI